jgi:hypothetical protein
VKSATCPPNLMGLAGSMVAAAAPGHLRSAEENAGVVHIDAIKKCGRARPADILRYMPKKKRSRRGVPPRPRTVVNRPVSSPLADQHQTTVFLHRIQADDGPTLNLPSMMVDGSLCPVVRLNGSEVKEYVDLASMRNDLDFVVTMCAQRAALAKLPDTLETMFGLRATWESAIIAYARTWAGGVSALAGAGGRTPFPAEILDRLTRRTGRCTITPSFCGIRT